MSEEFCPETWNIGQAMMHAMENLPEDYKLAVVIGNGFVCTLTDDLGGEHIDRYVGLQRMPEDIVFDQVNKAIKLDNSAKGITHEVSTNPQ